MKRRGDLWPQIVAFANLLKAARITLPVTSLSSLMSERARSMLTLTLPTRGIS